MNGQNRNTGRAMARMIPGMLACLGLAAGLTVGVSAQAQTQDAQDYPTQQPPTKVGGLI